MVVIAAGWLCLYRRLLAGKQTALLWEMRRFKANKHAVIKCGWGCKLLWAVMKQVTGTGKTTVEPKPSSRELDPIRAELEYQQHQPSLLWEKPITSSSYEQTAADVHMLQTEIGQSNDSNLKVMWVLWNTFILKGFRGQQKVQTETKDCCMEGKYWYVQPCWLIKPRENGILMLREY